MIYMNDNLPIKYFDKRVHEEDCPIYVPDKDSYRCELQDLMYEELFDENSHHIAKVTIQKITIAIFKRRTRQARFKRKLIRLWRNRNHYINQKTFRSFAYIFEYIKAKFQEGLKEGSFIDLGSVT
jgi:hypothetical protein